MMRRVSSIGSEPGTNDIVANNLSNSTRPIKAGENIQLFQINCHKCINSNLSLALHSQSYERFCYFVQEPYHSVHGNFLHITGGNRSLITHEATEPVRAIIVHSKNFPIIPLQQFTTKDLAAGLVTFKQKGMAAWQTKTLIVIFCYWDINVKEIPVDLQNIVQYAKSKNIGFQVHMDSNCHSTLFGSKNQNKRGNILEDFMALHGLVPGNVGNESTFIRRNSGMVIDLTFGTTDAIAQIRNWRVDNPNIMEFISFLH